MRVVKQPQRLCLQVMNDVLLLINVGAYSWAKGLEANK